MNLHPGSCYRRRDYVWMQISNHSFHLQHAYCLLIPCYGSFKSLRLDPAHMTMELEAPKACSSAPQYPLHQRTLKIFLHSFSSLPEPITTKSDQFPLYCQPALLFHFCPPPQASKATDPLTSPLCEQFSVAVIALAFRNHGCQAPQGLLWSDTCPLLLPYLVLFSALTLVPLRKIGLARRELISTSLRIPTLGEGCVWLIITKLTLGK